MTRLVSTRSALALLQLLSLLFPLLGKFASGFSTVAPPTTIGKAIARGDHIPDVCLNWGFNPMKEVNMKEYTAGLAVLIVGVPAAFTSTASEIQLPTFLEKQDELKELGIDNVIVYSVNDSAVVGVWNKNIVEAYGKPNSLVTFFGDPSGAFTHACGMQLGQTPDLTEKGFYGRCKNFAMYVVDNVVEDVAISESPHDPTGDINPEATCADSIIAQIKAIRGIDS